MIFTDTSTDGTDAEHAIGFEKTEISQTRTVFQSDLMVMELLT